MSQKYSALLHPIMKAIKQLLESWHNSNNGKQVKKSTNIFVRFIYKMSSAESEIKDAMRRLPKYKNHN